MRPQDRPVAWSRHLLCVAGATVLIATAMLGSSTPASGATGYSLALTASPADYGGPTGAEIPPAGEITYTILHHEQAPFVVYQFITPLGTTFVSARSLSGVSLTVSADAATPPASNPVGQPSVRITAMPTEQTGGIEVVVRLNAIWQGAIAAQASFIGTGLGGSNVVTRQVALPDGVPGQIVAQTFVDLNGNGAYDHDDIGNNCRVWVYQDLTGVPVPDTLSGPDDPRLPSVAVEPTDATGTARITLLPGRYAVLFSDCGTPLPPSGVPQTTFDVIQRPPPIAVTTVSGSNSYQVQTAIVAGTTLTRVLVAMRPLGPTAPPTAVAIKGGEVRWTDTAHGQTEYAVVVSQGSRSLAFTLPATATHMALPAQFLPPCGGAVDLSVAITALYRGVGGFPAKAEARIARACATARPPLLAPAAGSGPVHPPPWRAALPAALAALAGAAMLGLGAAGAHRGRR